MELNPLVRQRRPGDGAAQLFQPLAVVRGKQTLFYQAENEQDYQRVAKIRDEFNLRTALVGNGYEYRRAAQLKSLNMPVVVPLNFPVPPEVDNPDTAIDVPLDGLQHWEQAPSTC